MSVLSLVIPVSVKSNACLPNGANAINGSKKYPIALDVSHS